TQLTGHTDWVNAVAVAPDGRWLASAGNDQTMRIWDTATGESSALMRIDSTPVTCAWTPDGAALAVGAAAGLYLFAFQPGHRAPDGSDPGDQPPLPLQP